MLTEGRSDISEKEFEESGHANNLDFSPKSHSDQDLSELKSQMTTLLDVAGMKQKGGVKLITREN